jgi:hypothetical protein
MKRVWGFVLVAGVASWALAQEVETTEPQDKVDQLVQRIEELEKRVAELESSKPVAKETPAKTEESPAMKEENKIVDPEADIVKKWVEQIVPEAKASRLGRSGGPRSLFYNTPGTLPNPDNDIPSNWMRRGFNGFTFYVVPLADKSVSDAEPLVIEPKAQDR